jgi:alkanesulfonate monooxygenase SsuD/methylene tetrahydromethanopterin reductase-like flavin-dependent oxidoreductase (luciferase family)
VSGPLQLGIQIRPVNTTWPELREVALLAEEWGFDAIYTWDHLLPVAGIDPSSLNFEGWQLLPAWGALTTRVRVGLGAGQFELEHVQYGMTFPPIGERVDRLNESLEVVRKLLSDDRPSFEGRFYRLDEAFAEPKPLQARLPLLVGATGPRMLRVAARHADIWHGYARRALELA